ncbi:plasminogen receptor (KT) isoform X3 [Phocoena sinus]|uniref:plasminogen receptor (KT) isoform X3 n=1 Tax=Phocoena sinus TaxID=42100 RepID=UPI0013C51481|nr:plasminogen receptor (KT) isoform X3 [Phocoena sinus]
MNSGRQAGKKTPGLLGQARGPFKEDESCADRLRLGIPAMASQSQSSAGRDPVREAVSDSGLEASALISVSALPLPTAQQVLLCCWRQWTWGCQIWRQQRTSARSAHPYWVTLPLVTHRMEEGSG